MNNDIVEQVIELTKSDNPEISGAANTALSLFYKHNNNEISDEEFSELMNDIISLNVIQHHVDNVEYYRLIKKTFTALLTLRSILL